MRQRRFKLILCDLGNVLVKFDHRIAVKKILKFTDKSFDEVYQLFFDSPLTKDFEEGRISSRLFFKRISGKLHLKGLTFKEFVSIWSDIFFDNKGMVALLRRLKKNYRLHLVSNINELHYDFILQKFPEHLSLFDDVILSYQTGPAQASSGHLPSSHEGDTVYARRKFFMSMTALISSKKPENLK